MPTATCIFYLLCLGALYLFRILYRGWAIPYLLLVMITAPVLIFLISLPAMLKIELHMSGRPYLVKGSRGDMRFVFRSKMRVPVGRISLSLLVENQYTKEHFRIQERFYSVSNGETRGILIPTDACGKISFRIVKWECRDLLGFFAIRRKCPEVFCCTVLPSALKPEEEPDIEAACTKNMRLKPKYGGGFSEEYDLRDYRPGDPGNSIHWKLSSKTDRLIVKEALTPENDRIFVVLDDAGKDQRGLEVLRWLSSELCRRETPHWIVSGDVYPVENEKMELSAISSILSAPYSDPCEFDDSKARCIFYIRSGEVSAV